MSNFDKCMNELKQANAKLEKIQHNVDMRLGSTQNNINTKLNSIDSDIKSLHYDLISVRDCIYWLFAAMAFAIVFSLVCFA